MKTDILAQELGGAACRRGSDRLPLADKEMFNHLRNVNPSLCVGNPLTLVALKSWLGGYDAARLTA